MDEPSAKRIADAVRAELARAGVTQAEIGRALGLSQPAMSRRMAGTVEFSAVELQRIAHTLGVSVAALGMDVAA